jgi:enoyl-CoA hydratase/carnithine racemase
MKPEPVRAFWYMSSFTGPTVAVRWEPPGEARTTVDAMEHVVGIEISGDVATLTLDSQSNRNALSRALLAGLHDGIDQALAADARVLVLTHRGPAFCAGADLKERAAGTSDSAPFVEVLTRLMDLPVPTIAAVDGAVRAGGIGLMAACDLVVVAHTTTFALTEVRIGVAPAIISVPILRRVPAGLIAAPMLTGEPFTADEARSMGLVTHLSDDVSVDVAALTASLLAAGPTALRATKRLLGVVPTLGREEAFAEMQQLSDELFQGPEGAEGMRAFAEKRPPSWAHVVNTADVDTADGAGA